MFRPFRRDGNDDLGRGDRLYTAGIVLADPGLVEPKPVAHGNDLQVEQQSRVFGKRMLRRHEHAETDIGLSHLLFAPCFFLTTIRLFVRSLDRQ